MLSIPDNIRSSDIRAPYHVRAGARPSSWVVRLYYTSSPSEEQSLRGSKKLGLVNMDTRERETLIAQNLLIDQKR